MRILGWGLSVSVLLLPSELTGLESRIFVLPLWGAVAGMFAQLSQPSGRGLRLGPLRCPPGLAGAGASLGGVSCTLGTPCLCPPPLQKFLLPLRAALAGSRPILRHPSLARLWLSAGVLATACQKVASRRSQRIVHLASASPSGGGSFPQVSTCFRSLLNASRCFSYIFCPERVIVLCRGGR